MGEKKSIKINLKTYVIAMFLVLLVIGILLGYVLQTGEKINQEIVGKKDDKNLEESIVTEENIETENKKEIEKYKSFTALVDELKKEKITEDQIKYTLEKYLNIFHGYGAQEQLLNSLDLMTYQESQDYIADDENYKVTDIPYTEFENKIKEYTTIENFERLNNEDNYENPHFKNVDGHVAYFDGGWTGAEYIVNDVTLKGDDSDTRYVANYYTTEVDFTSQEMTLEFDIEIDTDNGTLIISNCYFE